MSNDCFLPPYVVNNNDPIMTLSETIDWGLQKLNIPVLHNKGITGKGIKVGVLDTGVDTDHPDLRIRGSYDFTGRGVEDQVGHGTHVAGIIGARGNNFGVRGVAPDCDLYVFKVLGGNSGKLSDVAAGIRAAADKGMDVINLSLGSSSDVKIIKDAVQYASNKGSILVCASGNSGTESISYPAKYSVCFATGSVDRYFNVSDFSSYGQELDIVAPGSKILSTYLKGGYAVLSGTSMATPFAAGSIALMKQAGILLTYSSITKSVRDIKDPNFDKQSGYGIIDPNVAIDKSFNDSNDHLILKELDIIDAAVDRIKKII